MPLEKSIVEKLHHFGNFIDKSHAMKFLKAKNRYTFLYIYITRKRDNYVG